MDIWCDLWFYWRFNFFGIMSRLFGKVFRVVENPFEESAGIELIDTEWEGLVYQYGKVNFVEGKPEIEFERSVRRLPKGVEETEENIEELLNNTELHTLMGDILVELLEEQVKKDEQRNIKSTDQEA